MPADVRSDANRVVRNVDRVDRVARVYESRWWYPLVLTVYAGWRKTSLPEIVRVAGEMVRTDGRLILDAACGPATLGRRIVSPTQALYGADISLGMLRAGQTFAQRERLTNVHFARARVEALPFRPLTFDAAICGGSLHLFPDTVAALREIGRTMKPGAPLAVTTFVAGSGGILRFRRVREHVRSGHGLYVFELPELESCLAQAGFAGFAPRLFGSFVVFRAVRRGANPGDAM
jgi:ubiquinone/menaquinone biosynthesis C-methylase UbiE